MKGDGWSMKSSRNNAGFTIVEALLAASISVVVSSAVIGVLYFYGRSLNDNLHLTQRRAAVDMAIDRIYYELLNSAKKDAFNNLIHPIEKISSDGREIIYQIITNCEGTNGVIESDGKNFCWGDGQKEGRYIRIFLDDNNNLWYERWDGKPFSGGVKIQGIRLAENVDFNVVGLSGSGFTVNNTMPVVIRISIEDKDIGYRRTLQVRLRGA